MLLLSLRRGPGARLTICPLLWLGALLPVPGLVALPFVAWRAWSAGSGILVSFAGMSAFLTVFAYVFYRATLGQQVRCRRQDSRLLVSAHAQQAEAEATAVQLTVAKSRVGGRHPLTVYDVTLSAPGCWRSTFLVHRGFTSSGAWRAAERMREQLGVRLAAGQQTRRVRRV